MEIRRCPISAATPVISSESRTIPDNDSFLTNADSTSYEFGTLGQFDYPYRDANDLVFSQLIMDYWTR